MARRSTTARQPARKAGHPSRARTAGLLALGLVCIAVWLLTGGYEQLRRTLYPAGPMLEPSSHDQPYLRDRYDRIREGMTLAEVRRIMGGHGEMVSALHTPAVPGVRAPIDTTMVKWENPDGGNCHVMFQNGVVVSRAQVGLP